MKFHRGAGASPDGASRRWATRFRCFSTCPAPTCPVDGRYLSSTGCRASRSCTTPTRRHSEPVEPGTGHPESLCGECSTCPRPSGYGRDGLLLFDRLAEEQQQLRRRRSPHDLEPATGVQRQAVLRDNGRIRRCGPSRRRGAETVQGPGPASDGPGKGPCPLLLRGGTVACGGH